MIAAILLAAGQSRRMGTQKLLLPFGGQTVIGHVADQFLQSRCDEVFIVVNNNETLRQVLSPMRVTLIENFDSQSDMLCSVRLGLQALSPNCQAVLIMPGDMPLIETFCLNQIIEAFSEEKIIVPVYEGHRGHPLLVPRCYFGEILRYFDGVGLRGLMQKHPREVCELAVNHSGVVKDMDLPRDYEKALLDFRPL